VVLARNARRRAVALSLLAAFLWALYYPLVLWAKPGASPSATIVYPFVFGGLGYAGYCLARRLGAPFWRLWREGGAWIRTGFLVAMQLSVLATTYLAGPVDSSLLSLIGDVVLTPVIVAFLWSSHRGNIGTSGFTAGLVLSLVGGTLTIVGGQSLGRVEGLGWLIVPAVPLSVAIYFLLSAQENERTPPVAVVGQSMVSAALLAIVLSPLLPGGAGSLGTLTPEALGLLAVCGVTSFFLAPLLYFRAIAEAGIVIPPMMMTGIPVFTLLLSAFVLYLGLPLLAVLGIPVCVGGALLTLWAESGPAPPGDAPGASKTKVR
jgi:drug/metabolite transporter (DMT)-like permease